MKEAPAAIVSERNHWWSRAWDVVKKGFDTPVSPEEQKTIFTRLKSLQHDLEDVSEVVHREIGKASWKLITGTPLLYFGLFDPIIDVSRDSVVFTKIASFALGMWFSAEGIVNVSRAIGNVGYARRLHDQIIILTGKIPTELAIKGSDKIPFI